MPVMNFKFVRCIHRVHVNKSPLKIWEKRERGRIQRLPKFVSTPFISGTGKDTNFKFGTHIHRVHANKSPLKLWRKGSMGVSRDCPNFFQYPLLSQVGVKLRTSSFVHTFLVSIGTKAHTNFREK